MFFCDVMGPAADPAIDAAIAGLRGHCEAVRVLGSFPAAG
jgi:prephenate dehydratase